MHAPITRMRTWWHSGDLDLLLAAGVDPASDLELRLRAAQVTKPRRLRLFASVLDTVVDAVETPSLATADLAVERDTIRPARGALLGLAQRLREPDVVGVRAGAMVSYLVRSLESPLHATSGGRRLQNFARDASDLIDAERQARRGLRSG
jgi:hypothetical protein